ncbi:MAG: hypothetical protein P8M17_07090 [Saprospiraceae bacterium]|nr:hypothetical protein [Saprospiraceae bacterium]MDG2418740.1 hypothetical protein [Saprospiraceae bacterium]
MKIQKKIQRNFKEKRYSRITRKISKKETVISTGYILNFSENFILMQGDDDFSLSSFWIFESSKITNFRYNKNDKYYDFIMESEGLKKDLKAKTKVNLSNWKTIFTSLKKAKKHIIVECENPKIDEFIIGEITDVNSKSVSIWYFNAEGILDKKPINVKFKNITKVTFDDKYIDTFSKYLRKNK